MVLSLSPGVKGICSMKAIRAMLISPHCAQQTTQITARLETVTVMNRLALRSEKPPRRYFFAGADACTFSHTVEVWLIFPSMADGAGSLTIVSLRPSILISRAEALSG